MRTRVRRTLLAGIGFVISCAALFAADSPIGPHAFASYCPVTLSSCGGERLEVATNASFKPTQLPRRTRAPIHLGIEGTIGTSDGSKPPPLEELIFEVDRNATLDAQGLPICRLARIKAANTSQALKACHPALVGKGTTNVEVAYPEQSPLLPKSELLAFNGGVKGGVTTIFIHSYLHTPVAEPVVMTAKVSKVHLGPYGTKLVATIPPIAKGAGSVTEFQLEFFRRFTFGRKERSFAAARCFDGKLQARVELLFFGGPPTIGSISRRCTVKG